MNIFEYLDYGELEFLATRSGGPGGQHVNKTNSCIQLRFSILNSRFPEEIKQKFIKKLQHKIVRGDIIQVRVESERDQKSNKDEAFRKLVELLKGALHEDKKRKPTKPTRSSVKKRLESKKRDSAIKKGRGARYD